MAKNRIRKDGYHLSVAVDSPASPVSGDPVRWGLLTGVALTNKGAGGNASTYTSVDFGPSEWDVSVKGVDDNGNSAVAVGDLIYRVDGDTPPLSKKASGYLFGVARGAVTSGGTATINVVHIPSPGSGSVASGAVTTSKLGAASVTAAKLTTTMATGFIFLPLTGFRLISANDIPNSGTADGGLLGKDTAPLLERVNAATDKQLRVRWAASGVVPITTQFVYPPDLDNASPVIVNLLAAMGGATDTPTVAVNYFENVGDTNAGGNTLAVTGTSVAQYTRSIAAVDVGAYPKAASVEFVPGAHTTDTLLLYGAWITYTRK